MSFKFPYQYGFIDNRKIPYPIVTVLLNTTRGERSFFFIMDTGADNLTLPKYMIHLLGVNKNSLKKSLSQGIGKDLVQTWEGRISITFCRRTFLVNCAFTYNDKTPFLLGKEDIFDKFKVIFDNERQMSIFEEIPTK